MMTAVSHRRPAPAPEHFQRHDDRSHDAGRSSLEERLDRLVGELEKLRREIRRQ